MSEPNNDRCQQFVNYVIARARTDTGYAARMRRADNPDTEYQSWGALASFGVNLENDRERLPFALIGAALCRAKPEQDGQNSIGAALAACFENGGMDEKDRPGANRLRKLLGCATVLEICQTLRPLLPFVADKSRRSLNYAGLLRDLLFFESRNCEKTKRRWAMDFFGVHDESGGDESDGSEK